MTLDPWLLEVLACPACKASLRPSPDADELSCTGAACGLVYPVRDEVPVLLVEEARRDADR